MWVMASFGILMPSVRPEGTIPEGDDRAIQIRVRRLVELERLKALYMPEMGEVIFMPNTDYEYRTYCTHAQLGEVLARIAMDIDYTKFKPTTERHGDSKLHAAYNSIWSILYDRFSTNRYLEQKPAKSARISERLDAISDFVYPYSRKAAKKAERRAARQKKRNNENGADMNETIELEARDLPYDFSEMAAGLDVVVLGVMMDRVKVNGNVFELATLVQRYESGDWAVPLDEVECGHDHAEAQIMIDQYVL